jgi:hypothetical protein
VLVFIAGGNGTDPLAGGLAAPLLGGAIGALVYRFVTPGWARGPGDAGGPGT